MGVVRLVHLRGFVFFVALVLVGQVSNMFELNHTSDERSLRARTVYTSDYTKDTEQNSLFPFLSAGKLKAPEGKEKAFEDMDFEEPKEWDPNWQFRTVVHPEPPELEMTAGNTTWSFKDIDGAILRLSEKRILPRHSCYTMRREFQGVVGDTFEFCYPAIILSGFGKCGTSAMDRFLKSHPQIGSCCKVVAGVDSKEYCRTNVENFAGGAISYFHYLKGFSEELTSYRDKHKGEGAAGEQKDTLFVNTCIQLKTGETPDWEQLEIYEALRRPKTIHLFMVRNPADRFWSSYNYWCNQLDSRAACLQGDTVIGAHHRSPTHFHEILMANLNVKLLGPNVETIPSCKRLEKLFTRRLEPFQEKMGSKLVVVATEQFKVDPSIAWRAIQHAVKDNLNFELSHHPSVKEFSNKLYNTNDKKTYHGSALDTSQVREGLYEISGFKPLKQESRDIIHSCWAEEGVISRLTGFDYKELHRKYSENNLKKAAADAAGGRHNQGLTRTVKEGDTSSTWVIKDTDGSEIIMRRKHILKHHSCYTMTKKAINESGPVDFCAPSLFIAGYSRCGTRALRNTLETVMEPHFAPLYPSTTGYHCRGDGRNANAKTYFEFFLQYALRLNEIQREGHGEKDAIVLMNMCTRLFTNVDDPVAESVEHLDIYEKLQGPKTLYILMVRNAVDYAWSFYNQECSLLDAECNAKYRVPYRSPEFFHELLVANEHFERSLPLGDFIPSCRKINQLFSRRMATFQDTLESPNNLLVISNEDFRFNRTFPLWRLRQTLQNDFGIPMPSSLDEAAASSPAVNAESIGRYKLSKHRPVLDESRKLFDRCWEEREDISKISKHHYAQLK
uniref:Sulfotransferase domain-containing protein n=2 Tax=Lotharella globosa TaxID=91324 RepID=A0A7S3Z2S2_9EUKA|mmetsp:Transcript_17858/g.36049  ORF Transcript_17858/g.36049 Transcript_17858/m.36049 type:complete len:842 (+) Transcript_17858:123-2648(+)